MKLLTLELSMMGLVLSLSGVIVAGPHGSTHNARHADIARRAEGNVQPWKREDHSRWSFYDVGLGACGKHNVASDFIVALNSNQFGGGYPGPHCFQMITMQYNGKTTKAQITDRCPGCGPGGLDLSRGLFKFFDSEDKGIIYGSWWFDGEGGPDPAPAPPKPHTTTRRYSTPTTTRRLPTPTKLQIPTLSLDLDLTKTRTRADRTSTSASSTSTNGTDGKSTGYASAAPAVATGVVGPNNMGDFNRALVGMGGLVVACINK